MFMQPTLRTGHALILMIHREKLIGGGQHFGVQLPNGLVAECVNPSGVRVVSLEEFQQGKDVHIAAERGPHEWPAIADRLTAALQERRPYHGTAWNCENFANWLIGERPVSKQVVAAAVLLGAIGVLALALD